VLLLLLLLLLLFDRKKNNLVYMREHGFAEEMLDGLLNLDLALQCDGFVSSINSNWARCAHSWTGCKGGDRICLATQYSGISAAWAHSLRGC
jgi:hypothetical protein